MHAIAGNELTELLTKNIILVDRNMVELIDSDQPIIEDLNTETLYCKTKRGVRADKDCVVAF